MFVAYFRPMKIVWRNILLEWKKKDGKKESCVPKACFPKLLKKLMEELNKNARNNIVAGFRKTGINPVDQNQVLSRLPTEGEGEEEEVEKSILDLLKELRYGTTSVNQTKRKKKLNVIAGRSVRDGTEGDETEDYVDSEDGDVKNKKRKEAAGTKKGKGKGKKSKKQNEKEVMDQNEKLDIELMPFVYDDEFEIENEYTLGLPMCEEDNKDRFEDFNTSTQVLSDILNIEKEEKQKNKINIISIENYTCSMSEVETYLL